MKRIVACLVLLAGVAAMLMLERDPSVSAQSETPSKVSRDLEARIEAIEQMLSFHSHEADFKSIEERLDRLQSEALKHQRDTRRANEPASQKIRAMSNSDLSKIRSDVKSLSSKLSSLERSIGPLKQDISKLKLGLSRLETTVTRIDLRR